MEVIVLIIVAHIFLLLKEWITHQWTQWRGAYGRCREGQPLRLRDAQLQMHTATRAKLNEEKRRMRSAYEISPSLILQPAFRSRFLELGIGDEIRAEVKQKHGMICAGCDFKIRFTLKRHIDHIKPKKLYPELEFIHTNLQVLCQPCNAHKSAYDGDDWKEVVIARRKQTKQTINRRKKT